MTDLEIQFANRQLHRPVDGDPLIQAVRHVLLEHGFSRGEVSLAVVSDEEIHTINRQFLNHDYPTDVISFVLEKSGDRLVGEIVASIDYAAGEAQRYGWQTGNELLLYFVHGALHLVGFDDTSEAAAAEMRAAERRALAIFGLVPPGRD